MDDKRDALMDEALHAQKAIFVAIQAAAEPIWLSLDLSMMQWKALQMIAHKDAITVGQVADCLDIGKPAASILIEQLVKHALVERTTDPLDRRRSIVRLSLQGEELVTRLRQGNRDRIRNWLSRLTDEDLSALVQGLRALAKEAAGERPVA